MVLLVVDTQQLITTEGLYQFDRFVENVSRILTAARDKQVEVIYVRHDDGQGSELTKGTVGFEIYDKFRPFAGERIFDKKFNSAFKSTGLMKYLNEKSVKDITIVGLQTDYCIDATIKCGFEHGFQMIVPAYTNSTYDNQFMTAEQSYHYYNDFMWNGRYAQCFSVEEAIQRMSTK
ncbi:MAG: isochorismatase hydrolase [Herbinix sp.]|jgi:nicotinamidase-related amidase|nr:isochorismatase hydrolase [Herbinix sp.]